MKHNGKRSDDYARLKMKVFFQGLGLIAIAYLIISAVYLLFWRGRGGDWLVSCLRSAFHVDLDTALALYQRLFQANTPQIWLGAVLFVFIVLFFFFLTWFTRYFNEISRGIDALLVEPADEIVLPPEMSVVEKKLNAVRKTLNRRAMESQQAEQRKNDLVMNLAHDIRTPLTSVIGYLGLLDEAPDMPPKQKAKYVHITLDKANRLEKLVNEFFEITRYNLQQIKLQKEDIDLSYMLIQMKEEFYPILSAKGNTVVLNVDHNLTVNADPMKLARVFNNILKNAASYSHPDSEILISAVKRDPFAVVSIQNQGPAIPQENLSAIFEKFYRLDDARLSDTGGAGLGLAIAKEIVTLHGGTIDVKSSSDSTTFTVSLPISDEEGFRKN